MTATIAQPLTAQRRRAVASDYRLDDQAGFIMRKASQRHTALFAAMIGDETTPTQWAVIAKLLEGGPSPQNSLGRNTAMDAATVKGVVDRLKARGIVDTGIDPGDGRLVVVTLTTAGRRLAEQLLPRAAAITAETLKPLTPSERRVFLDLLRRLG